VAIDKKENKKMNNNEFIAHSRLSFERSISLLNKKEKEYSNGRDRLEQFYRAASAQRVNPVEALIGMATKHYTKLADMAKDPTNYTYKQWHEVLDDLRNYTLLADALITEVKEDAM
jgi:hypothetical protein